ncbi:nicotinate (nicotinamide) nucleotide adenylyltransferase [Alistipes sp. ZOR0009]|uniref:nicotinate (nicotinamide) nucleotide adenylyltransferase n=1 Tax=Alistipes sp. ZOR0009 TaxID=1339253 RepID=UPI000648FB81|nr:nicotinate (nicotinamide) nucleotide adenylyltransferase [Alistipes sp. ZOR0009]
MFVGLYFGSFNPIHNGHISIATQMLQKVGFDEIWFIVSPLNPLKTGAELASNIDRLRMVELAVADQNFPFKASDVEFNLPTPSYTIDTLSELKHKYPTFRFGIIMGSDNVASIERWKSYREILLHYSIFFFPRLGDDSDFLAEKYGVTKIQADYLDISSTQIRMLVGKGMLIDGLVSDLVRSYIQINNLYLSL